MPGNKYLNKVSLVLGLAVVVAGAYSLYVYNKPARNVQNEKAVSIHAQTLFKAFSTNETQANELYLNKAIAVTGEVTSVKTNQENKTVVSFKTLDPMFGVQCTLANNETLPDVGSILTIKGICTGFLMDVILIDAYVQE